MPATEISIVQNADKWGVDRGDLNTVAERDEIVSMLRGMADAISQCSVVPFANIDDLGPQSSLFFLNAIGQNNKYAATIFMLDVANAGKLWK